ncbi:MAG: ABC transporter ATP-binding protein [Candidatus Devosia euplotis]|nr:ABC transporter ATP-binding protein [Candidatus Devosia euplotis]
MTALSPVHTIGVQIMRTVRLHMRLSRAAARERAMIALAISCDPSLLIADEPTTALDVTTEAQILDLLKQFQLELGMAIIFITHNFGVVADIADQVSVMYLGKIVETASVDDIFYAPKHLYTQALLRSIPRLGVDQGRRLPTIPSMVSDPFSVPPGCAFNPRCSHAITGLCETQLPPEKRFGNQTSRCHIADQFTPELTHV